jgi:hypothetical protein
MCAAPGSKTFQLLEAVHAAAGGAGAQGRESDPPAGIPQGYVVANDADFKRCMLLTHQTKRGCSPCLLVTNHNAEAFPMLKTKSHPEVSLKQERTVRGCGLTTVLQAGWGLPARDVLGKGCLAYEQGTVLLEASVM